MLDPEQDNESDMDSDGNIKIEEVDATAFDDMEDEENEWTRGEYILIKAK